MENQNLKIREQTKNRVRLHRKVKSILVNERRMFEMYLNQNDQLSTAVQTDCIDSKQQTLRTWALKHRIKQNALTDLLKILKSLGLSWLPNDSRTFLKTPRAVMIRDIAGGKHWYNGISRNISNVFSGLQSDITISLNFNIDGMAPFKSSKKQIWPILANIHGN